MNKKIIVANRIRQIREDHRHTREYLAQKLGVSVGTIKNYENNQTIPTLEFTVDFCEFYKISLYDILYGYGCKNHDLFKRLEHISPSNKDLIEHLLKCLK